MSSNQELLFDGLESWTYGAGRDADSPIGAFRFEAFDEPWKTADGWGSFDTNRNTKYVLWSGACNALWIYSPKGNDQRQAHCVLAERAQCVWKRGAGTRATRRQSSESGSKSTATVPSLNGFFSAMRTRPSGPGSYA